VIEGFLDVSLPMEDVPANKEQPEALPLFTPGPRKHVPTESQTQKQAKTSKHLFTVKAGGIAGYLGKSLGCV
jgi:hypothetical protein